ncbi:MAG: Hpt domain-containing protein [Bryobacteraceae bacterium]
MEKFLTFDLPWALSRLGDDSSLLAELARLFIEESRTLMPALRAAVEQRDARAIEIAAHALKGSVANFGAREVWQDALALEQSGRGCDLTGIDKRLAAFEQSAARFISEMKMLAGEK